MQKPKSKEWVLRAGGSDPAFMRLVRRGPGHCGSRKKKLAVCLYSTVTLFARFLG